MSTATTAIQRLRKLPTAAVSDALDAARIPGVLLGIARRTTPGNLAGRAFTVRYEEITEPNGTVGDFLDDVSPGDVVVIDNSGRTDCTTWGGIMSRVAVDRGVAGTVLHGACRDIATSEQVQYPVWSVAVTMRTGKDRVQCAAVQGRIRIADVDIDPGDYILADADGAVCVPQDRIDEVLELAEHIDATEARIVASALNGNSLAQARQDLAYHTLQTPSAH